MKHLFYSKKLKYILMFTLVFCMFFSIGQISYSYIFAQDDVPTIIVGQNGSSTVRPIFTAESGLWYPGYSASSVLRVVNEYSSTVNLNKLGMDIILERNGERLKFEEIDAIDYMDKMLIRIDYRNPMKRLVEGNIFNGKFSDFIKGKECSLQLGKKDYIDLVYTVKMDESAKVNIAGITSKPDFTVLVAEANIGNSGNDGRKSKKDDDIIEVPAEPIPEAVGHWAHDCIVTLLDHGIITGYEDGTIKPDNFITRVEAAALVSRALKLEQESNAYLYYIDDISIWAQGYVAVATKKGIFTGYPDKTFKADRFISREEMTTVLVRAFLADQNNNIQLEFLDKDEIGSWALGYVKLGVKNEVITGYPDGTFKPKNSITRAEAFTIICKLLGYHIEH